MFFKRQQGSNQPITLGEIPEGCRLLTAEELQCVSGGKSNTVDIPGVEKISVSISYSSKFGICMTFQGTGQPEEFNYGPFNFMIKSHGNTEVCIAPSSLPSNLLTNLEDDIGHTVMMPFTTLATPAN